MKNSQRDDGLKGKIIRYFSNHIDVVFRNQDRDNSWYSAFLNNKKYHLKDTLRRVFNINTLDIILNEAVTNSLHLIEKANELKNGGECLVYSKLILNIFIKINI